MLKTWITHPFFYWKHSPKEIRRGSYTLFLISSHMFYLFFFSWFYCQQQFKTWISSLSLDDIERLATIHMKEASSYWCNVITVNSRPRNFGISAKFVVPKQPLIPFDLPLLKKMKGLGNGIGAQLSAGFSIQKGKKMSWHCCLLPLSFALMSV